MLAPQAERGPARNTLRNSRSWDEQSVCYWAGLKIDLTLKPCLHQACCELSDSSLHVQAGLNFNPDFVTDTRGTELGRSLPHAAGNNNNSRVLKLRNAVFGGLGKRVFPGDGEIIFTPDLVSVPARSTVRLVGKCNGV